jgi:hypothetical protein
MPDFPILTPRRAKIGSKMRIFTLFWLLLVSLDRKICIFRGFLRTLKKCVFYPFFDPILDPSKSAQIGHFLTFSNRLASSMFATTWRISRRVLSRTCLTDDHKSWVSDHRHLADRNWRLPEVVSISECREVESRASDLWIVRVYQYGDVNDE